MGHIAQGWVKTLTLAIGSMPSINTAITPAGMRAISTEISPETGAGGFILPNDRVDVILSKRDKNRTDKGAPTSSTPEIILTNIRVLAIDQAPKEKDGQNARGRQDRHARAAARRRPRRWPRARQSGTLSLALRSIVDVKTSRDRSTKPRSAATTASTSSATALPARRCEVHDEDRRR